LTALPESIGELAELRVLDVGMNRLAELPPSISNLRKLETLLAGRNEITALPDLNRSPLKRVDLNSNKLAGIPEYLRLRQYDLPDFEFDYSGNPAVDKWYHEKGLGDEISSARHKARNRPPRRSHEKHTW
jgi:Leucine-rich repeat (LRR) protein